MAANFVREYKLYFRRKTHEKNCKSAFSAFIRILYASCSARQCKRGRHGDTGWFEVSLTTDKDAYAAGEEIQVSVNIKNNNAYKVEGLSVEIQAPEGLALKTNLPAGDFAIEAGASYAVPVVQLSEDKGTKPADTTQTGNNQDASSPQTDDSSNIVLWVTLLMAVAAGIVLASKSKKTAKLMSLFLCLAAVLVMLPVSVKAENKTEITVDKTITVDGKEYTIVCKVKKPAGDVPAASSTESTASTEPASTGTENTASTEPANTGTENTGSTEPANTGTENTGSTEPANTGTEIIGSTEPAAENFGTVSRTMPEDYPTEPVPFKDEIDEFTGYVKEYSREEFGDAETIEEYDWYLKYGYAVGRKLEIDGIHFYEARPTLEEEPDPLPLVIQIHGGGGSKDFGMAASHADINVYGLCVVSIDAPAHGESQAGPLQGPAVWMEAVMYIDTLIEYYNTRPDVDAAKFGVIGFSMGGNITEYYVLYGKYKPAAVCIEGATADATGEFSAAAVHNKGGGAPEYSVWSEEQTREFTTATAPKNFPEYFKDIPMFVCVGALDDTHNPDTMQAFVEAVEALGNDQIVFHRYEDKGHEYIEEWEKNEKIQFFEMLKSL